MWSRGRKKKGPLPPPPLRLQRAKPPHLGPNPRSSRRARRKKRKLHPSSSGDPLPEGEGQSMWLIIGLGTPGTEYAGTYHSAGFRVLERIAARQKVQINEPCGPALISAKTTLGAQSVLVLPQTYMNNSGAVISPLFER